MRSEERAQIVHMQMRGHIYTRYFGMLNVPVLVAHCRASIIDIRSILFNILCASLHVLLDQNITEKQFKKLRRKETHLYVSDLLSG